jgi:hypothetical protein
MNRKEPQPLHEIRNLGSVGNNHTVPKMVVKPTVLPPPPPPPQVYTPN